MRNSFSIAVIPGDGIGTEVTAATLAIIDAAQKRAGGFSVAYDTMSAGASYYSETGLDIEPDGETRAGQADAIFLGAIGDEKTFSEIYERARNKGQRPQYDRNLCHTWQIRY